VREEKARHKNNIVFIVGGRGAGKSTAALSLLRSRKDGEVFEYVTVYEDRSQDNLMKQYSDLVDGTLRLSFTDDPAAAAMLSSKVKARMMGEFAGDLPAPMCFILNGIPSVCLPEFLPAFKVAAQTNLWFIVMVANIMDIPRCLRRHATSIMVSPRIGDDQLNTCMQAVPSAFGHTSIRRSLHLASLHPYSWVCWETGGGVAETLTGDEISRWIATRPEAVPRRIHPADTATDDLLADDAYDML
jgi:hypothetical protein